MFLRLSLDLNAYLFPSNPSSALQALSSHIHLKYHPIMFISDLPAELLDEITEYLFSSFSHGSLASLSQTCRHLWNFLVPRLYRTLVLFKWDMQQEVEFTPSIPEGLAIPNAWKHTR
jgi:hypothetical protein